MSAVQLPATGAAARHQQGDATGAASADAAAIAADAVRNQQLNAVAIGARGGSSTGASVSTRVETMVPLSAFTSFGPGTTPLSVNHQGVFVATTFSFGLPPGVSMSEALGAIQNTMARINVPISVHGETAGTAQLFQKSFANMPFLLLAAILTIYITLGMLYESLIHPDHHHLHLAFGGRGRGAGAVDVQDPVRPDRHHRRDPADRHRQEERHHHDRLRHRSAAARGLNSRDAIYKACLLRFRPIMMTTTGAILGALPLAIGLGEGSELRQPLGISIVGGLFLSQILTLYTTPVVFLYMDRFGDLDVAASGTRWYHGMMGDKPGRSCAGAAAVAGGVATIAASRQRFDRVMSEFTARELSSNAILQIRQIVRAPLALPSLILALRLWRYRLRVVA